MTALSQLLSFLLHGIPFPYFYSIEFPFLFYSIEFPFLKFTAFSFIYLILQHWAPFTYIYSIEFLSLIFTALSFLYSLLQHWVSFTHNYSIEFPFLVLLISGGHSILTVAQDVDRFLLIGRGLDTSPGDCLEKVCLGSN